MLDRRHPGFLIKAAAAGLPFLAVLPGCGDKPEQHHSTTPSPIARPIATEADNYLTFAEVKRSIIEKARLNGHGAVIIVLTKYKEDLNVRVSLKKTDGPSPKETILDSQYGTITAVNFEVGQVTINNFETATCGGEYQFFLSVDGGKTQALFGPLDDNGKPQPVFSLDANCSATLDIGSAVQKLETLTQKN